MLEVFILGVIWGSAFAVARFVVRGGLDPIIYTFLSVAIPTLIMFMYCWRANKFRKLCTTNLSYYCIAGLFGIVIPNTSKYILAQYLPSGILAVIVGTTPLFIYPLALLVREEKFKVMRLAGVLFGGAGIILLAMHHIHLGHTALNYDLLAALIIPFSYAACAIYVAKNTASHHDLTIVTTGMLLAATIFLAPFTVLTMHGFTLEKFLSPIIDALIILTAFLSIIGYILLFKILAKYGSVNYGVVDGIGGITGLIWGWFFFKEGLHTNTIWAIILIILGTWIITTHNHQKTPKQDNSQ